MLRRRRLLAGVALVVLALGVAAAVYVHNENQPTEKRGSASEEFVTDAAPEPKPPPKRENPRPWPTYGYDAARSHISPYDHRPPYRRVWSIDAHDSLEFPPAVGYGRVYLAQQKGLFFALNAKTGKVRLAQEPERCAASSPTIGDGVVYQSYMHPVRVPQGQPGANGFVVAWDAADRPRAVALQGGADRVLAAAARRAPLLRLLGPQRLRPERRHRPQDLVASRRTTR